MLKPLLWLCVLVLATVAFAQNTFGPGSVSVTGTGTVYGEPDRASFDVGVSALNRDVRVANDEVNTRVAEVMEALRAAGVRARDLRTVSFNIYPEQSYGPNGQPGELRYRVVNVLHVRVRDTVRLGALLARSVEAGANEVSNVQYTFADPDALERRARERAMADAREKARQLASLGGVELDAVRRIVEGRLENVQPFAEARFDFDTAETQSTEVPVSSGQLSVTVTLQVTFGINP